MKEYLMHSIGSIDINCQHHIYTYETQRCGMNRNVGSTDQVLRTAAGAVAGTASIAILAEIISLSTVLSPVLGVIALVMLTTAAVGTCPVYSVLGVDSCSRNATPI